MTSIFTTQGQELDISLLMTGDSRRIITMVTLQNGHQSHQAQQFESGNRASQFQNAPDDSHQSSASS